MKKKTNRYKSKILAAEREIYNQRFHYKDKPVTGEPTNRQTNAIKSFCRSRKLDSNIIGINRLEASEILTYFFNKSGNEIKPKCWEKYIIEN